jgi:hypothetical protein
MRDAGLGEPHSTRLGDELEKSGHVLRTGLLYRIKPTSRATVAGWISSIDRSPALTIAPTLRSHLNRISNPDTAAFVDQAIVCLEAKQYRAAVVFSWVGAVAVLYDHVINNCLKDFNNAAIALTAKSKRPWQPAKTADDLSEMKESEFLVVLERIGVIDKNLKRQLEIALGLRNSCGHPNSYVVLEHKASAHIEDLIANVFSRF